MILIISVLSLFAVNFSGGAAISARAVNEKYSRILSEDVMMYMDSSLSVPWFTLPYSYYVKVLSVSGTSAKVEYRGDNPSRPSAKGYIKTEDLNFTEEIPQTPYPAVTLTVNQTCLLYKDSDFTITETITQNSTADYYGTLTRHNGEKYIYCLVNTTFGDKYLGYMSINSVFPFSIPTLNVERKIDSSEDEESVPETNSEISSASGNSVQIVIIIAVSAVAISIVYLLFRPSGKRAAKDEAITSNEFGDDDY